MFKRKTEMPAAEESVRLNVKVFEGRHVSPEAWHDVATMVEVALGVREGTLGRGSRERTEDAMRQVSLLTTAQLRQRVEAEFDLVPALAESPAIDTNDRRLLMALRAHVMSFIAMQQIRPTVDTAEAIHEMAPMSDADFLEHAIVQLRAIGRDYASRRARMVEMIKQYSARVEELRDMQAIEADLRAQVAELQAYKVEQERRREERNRVERERKAGLSKQSERPKRRGDLVQAEG